MPLAAHTLKVEYTGTSLAIYIKGLPHLFIDDKIEGFQSWLEVNGENSMYVIEFHTAVKDYKTEYASKHLWASLLSHLDKKIIKRKA